MSCCQTCCCLQSSCCGKATRRSFVAASSLTLLVYFSLLVGGAFAAAGFVRDYFSVENNNLDFYFLIFVLSLCSVLFIVGTSTCVSMCAHRCSICPGLNSCLSIILFVFFGTLFFLQVMCVTTLSVGSFITLIIDNVFNYTQQTCCVEYTGARVCYPFWDACHAMQGNNSTTSSSMTTFQTSVRQQLLLHQLWILGSTLFAALLLLVLGISSGRLGCMLFCGDEVTGEQHTIAGEFMYVIDAFLDKRSGKKIPPAQFARETLYNVDSWPRH